MDLFHFHRGYFAGIHSLQCSMFSHFELFPHLHNQSGYLFGSPGTNPTDSYIECVRWRFSLGRLPNTQQYNGSNPSYNKIKIQWHLKRRATCPMQLRSLALRSKVRFGRRFAWPGGSALLSCGRVIFRRSRSRLLPRTVQ